MRAMQVMMLIGCMSWAGTASGAVDVAGDWQGTLAAGGAELHLVLHVSKAADGALKATLDSVDQGAYGIPVTSITLKDSKLVFGVDSVHGSYEGTVSANGESIDGTWTQGQPLPLKLTREAAHANAGGAAMKPSDIDGAWIGTLDTGATKLRVVFHILTTKDGLIRGTLDSPDQGAHGIPVDSVVRNGPQLTLNVKAVGGKFEGRIKGDSTAIEGTWSQGEGRLPLTLRRLKSTADLELRRSQNPTPPFPYREELVTFENTAAGVKLAATLNVPRGQGPFPGVVLISGSGPNNRDEAVMGHKPFLVISDFLARRNFAVLRYDKRGVGGSSGVYAKATTADFASDAGAAIAYLRSRPEVDAHRVGLLGHSEGGEIAPMVAANDPMVAFVVMLAGPGVPGDQLLVEQTQAIAMSMGVPREKVKSEAADERELLMLVKSSRDDATLENQMRVKLAGKMPEAQLGATIRQASTPWFRYFVNYDPAPVLERVKCPVLALIGEKDTQVPPQQNLPALRAALKAGGNKDFEVDEMPGLNHLFQPARTGAPAEYSQIETTISPLALDKIANWMEIHTRAK